MTIWAFLNHWWNLPFLVMLGLVGVYFVLQLVGFLEHDAEAEHEVDADVDADADHDVDADHDADAEGEGLLAYFGVGHVPLMVVWVTFFIFAGFTGIALNRSIFEALRGAYPALAFVPVLLGSTVVGLFAVRFFSRLAAKLVDTGGRGASSKHELAGHLGVVASASLDVKFGEIRVRDTRGNEMLVHAYLDPGTTPMKRGDRVVLLDYDESRGVFRAAELTGRDA